jgi:biopolymer transport protein ExbD
MSFSNNNQDEVLSEINMTPLVDVMLVLLIIFMITVPVMTHSVKIDLPQTSNTPNEIKPETVTISIPNAVEVHWNNEVVNNEELTTRLTVASEMTPQPEVQIRGSNDVAYQHVMKVMSAIQNAGLEKLGFVTDPSDR